MFMIDMETFLILFDGKEINNFDFADGSAIRSWGGPLSGAIQGQDNQRRQIYGYGRTESISQRKNFDYSRRFRDRLAHAFGR